MITCDECVMKNTDGCPAGCMLESNTIDASKIKIKPIGFYTGESITNQQMLATISAEEFFDKIMWLLHEYGKRYTDSRLAIIEWLNSEVGQKEQ